MEWVRVNSRLISEIAFSESTGILHVRLKNRTVKTYSGITQATFENLKSADSPGLYYSDYIENKSIENAGILTKYGRFRIARLAATLAMTFVFLFSTNMITG